MTDKKLINRLKKMSYTLGSIEFMDLTTLVLLVVGVRNVLSSEFHNMITLHDTAFYFMVYITLFCYSLAFISIFHSVSNTEKAMKRLGVAVIK